MSFMLSSASLNRLDAATLLAPLADATREDSGAAIIREVRPPPSGQTEVSGR